MKCFMVNLSISLRKDEMYGQYIFSHNGKTKYVVDLSLLITQERNIMVHVSVLIMERRTIRPASLFPKWKAEIFVQLVFSHHRRTTYSVNLSFPFMDGRNAWLCSVCSFQSQKDEMLLSFRSMEKRNIILIIIINSTYIVHIYGQYVFSHDGRTK